MRKFSTYDGLYTKKPTLPKSKPTELPLKMPEIITEEHPLQTEILAPPQLSAKAIKCYSAIKQHDILVKSILKKD